MASTQEHFLGTSHSRRLLLSAPPPAEVTDHDPTAGMGANTPFDTNAVMVLSVLLCALVCSLALNSIIRCVQRCSNIANRAESGQAGRDVSQARLANTGIKKRALKTFPIVNYTDELKLPGLGSDCAICLSEFAPGERVRVLPTCNHGFHVRCIDKWLNSHSSCPTCRHCLIHTCQKIVGCEAPTTAASSGPALPQTAAPAVAAQEAVVVRIEPLDREGLVPNYHN